MSALHISAGALARVSQGLREAPEMTRRELLAAMTQATLLVHREAVDGMPRGATGLTAQSITSDAWSEPAGVLGVVGSAQAAAIYVELGTKPHMPPVAALIPWVKAVLGVDDKRAPSVAYLVARKIARKGTKAQHVFEEAAGKTAGQVLRMFEDAASRIAAHLASLNGSAA